MSVFPVYALYLHTSSLKPYSTALCMWLWVDCLHVGLGMCARLTDISISCMCLGRDGFSQFLVVVGIFIPLALLATLSVSANLASENETGTE